MKVGFYYQYTIPGSEIHLEVGRYLLESVRRVMPGVPVVQFTDADSAELDGIDEVRRISEEMPMAVRRMQHHAHVDGDWLFVDTDVVIQQDVRPVFNRAFDIAVTDRKGTEMEGTPYAESMPYNMGVTFSRQPKFWEAVLRDLLRLPRKLQQWEGDQHAVCHLVQKCLSGNAPFQCKVLPGRVYNYPPIRTDEALTHAAIVHYKGRARKGWINESRAVA